MIAAVRYSHLKPKLCALGAPTSSAMERVLQRDNGDVTVKKLTALLRIPPKTGDDSSSSMEEAVQDAEVNLEANGSNK